MSWQAAQAQWQQSVVRAGAGGMAGAQPLAVPCLGTALRSHAARLLLLVIRGDCLTHLPSLPPPPPPSLPRRYTAFTQGQQAGLSQVAYEVEDLMGFIQRQHDAAMGAVRGQPAPAPAGAPLGGRAGGAAAAAPGVLLGGADGAPLAPTGA